MESMEELRDTKAIIDKLAAGLISPQEIVGRRGRDLEDVYKEIEQAEAMREDHKVTIDLGKVSTNLKNNPAAVIDQGKSAAVDISPHTGTNGTQKEALDA